MLGGGLGFALGVGVGEGGGEDGSSDFEGVGSVASPPDEPPAVDPVWPAPALGTGPDGATVREGVSGAEAFGVAFAEDSPSSSPSSVPRDSSRPIRRGPSPRPSVVTPPGPGAAFLPSPCGAALPGGLSCPGSLTLIHPASDAASADTVTAAATRASGRPPDQGRGAPERHGVRADEDGAEEGADDSGDDGDGVGDD